VTRPLRLEHPGALWHVTSRGNEKRDVYRDDADRGRFLRILGRTVRQQGWILHAYVLMGNHYHLLMETPEPNLSSGIHDLNGLYAQTFNRRHERVGHLFQGRFKAILLERETHLLELVRYIVLNPVRAGFVSKPGDWRWSNFRATCGLVRCPTWLATDWTLRQFGTGKDARTAYRAFVGERLATRYRPWKQLEGQVFLGSPRFCRRLKVLEKTRAADGEIPRVQRSALRPHVDVLIDAVRREFRVGEKDLTRRGRTPVRSAFALLARRIGLIRLTTIAPHLGVGISAVSRLATDAERLLRRDAAFCRRVRRIESAIRSDG
jgi:putative transposase